jgi:hypothetical protein
LREHATAQHAGVLDFEPQHASDFAPVWLILQGAEISFSFSHSFQAIASSRKWFREGVVGVAHRFGRGSVGTIHG